MLIEKTFTVPSYYKKFACKAGACRHTCCEGLAINITQKEYHRLVGLDCSKELREQLDLALYVLAHPDEYKYACISPTYTGRCRMLDKNGLCALQKECGYDILTRVCKYYPRHPVPLPFPECSMSNSCEETIELFLDDNMEWGLEELPLSFELPGFISSDYFQDHSRQDNRHKLTFIMAQDTIPLTSRLRMIDEALFENKPIEYSNHSLPGNTAQNKSPNGTLIATVFPTNCQDFTPDEKPPVVHTRALIRLLEFAEKEYTDLALSARRTKDYLVHLLRYGSTFDEEALRVSLEELQAHFDGLDSPLNFRSFLSKTLANGMFYHGFPFGNGASDVSFPHVVNKKESSSSLRRCLTNALTVLYYAVFLLTAVLFANQDVLTSADSLVDLTAAFSRMVDLSDFDRRVLAAHSSHDSDFPYGKRFVSGNSNLI